MPLTKDPSALSLKALSRATDLGVWEIAPDGSTLFANEAMCRMLEVDSPAELGECTYHGFFSQESLETFHREHAKRRQGRSSSYEVELIGKKGTRRPMMINGVPVTDEDGSLRSLIGLFTDVSELRAAYDRLALSEARFRMLVEEASVAIVVTTQDGKILEVNNEAAHMLGYEREELLSMHAETLITEESQREQAMGYPDLRRGATLRRERVMRKKDGALLPVEGNVRLLPDGTVQGIFRDASERHRREAERQNLEARLNRTERLQSLGRLSGGIAHDFNNLLTVIIGELSELQEEGVLRLDNAMQAALRAAELTRQLLAFGRQQPPQEQRFDVNVAARSVVAMMSRLIEANILLETRLSDAPLFVEADETQVHQVMTNLLLNARDAMPNGGRVTLATSLRRLTEACDTTTGTITPGDYTVVEVSDEGHGIPETHFRQLFEPFFTTKGLGEGSGLGLATVYGIVMRHQGSIDVSSTENVGSTFTVYLPVDFKARVNGPGPATVISKPPPHATILVVEDQAMVRKVVLRTLTSRGYTVLEAVSAEDAFERYGSRVTELDLLITDIVMPGMQGPEFAKRLKQQRDGLRVLYMSGYTHEAAELTEPFLLKPFRPKDLLRRVDELFSP